MKNLEYAGYDERLQAPYQIREARDLENPCGHPTNSGGEMIIGKFQHMAQVSILGKPLANLILPVPGFLRVGRSCSRPQSACPLSISKINDFFSLERKAARGDTWAFPFAAPIADNPLYQVLRR
jgi:hypothetical protein